MLDRIESLIYSRSVYNFVLAANIGWCLCALRANFATSAEAWWKICLAVLGLFVYNSLAIALCFLAAFVLLTVFKALVWIYRVKFD